MPEDGTGITIEAPGGPRDAKIIDCSPQRAPGRQYFVAHFVPAHQVIEIEWWRNEKAEEQKIGPYRTRVPVQATKQFS